MTQFKKVFCTAESNTNEENIRLYRKDMNAPFTSVPFIVMNTRNNETYLTGAIETPLVKDLINRAQRVKVKTNKRNNVKIVQGDIRKIMTTSDKSVIQMASQFNLLEMISPNVTPKHGITVYEQDRTQGPACAIGTYPSTYVRNYAIPVNKNGIIDYKSNLDLGQLVRQVDCLYDLHKLMCAKTGIKKLWEMQNGYLFINKDNLSAIDVIIKKSTPNQYLEMINSVRIGTHWVCENSDVENKRVFNTMAICSALPIAYNDITNMDLWENFAKLILRANYIGTISTGIINSKYIDFKNKKVILTLLGGGVFGNEMEWIYDSIYYAIELFRDADISIVLNSYGKPDRDMLNFVEYINKN